MNPDVLRYFHPVLPARSLRRRPVRVQIAGRAYALFRDASGRPAALDDLCPGWDEDGLPRVIVETDTRAQRLGSGER